MHAASSLLAVLAMTSVVTAVVHRVNVAKGGLNISPNNTMAAVGDTIDFHFYSGAHSVVQGAYNTPCRVGPLQAPGFNSGFMRVTSAPSLDTGGVIFRIQINDTDPIWYYCAQAAHCTAGMVGVVNPPNKSSGRTLDEYRAGAATYMGVPDTPPVLGGVVISIGNNGASSTITPTSSPPSSTTTSEASSTSSPPGSNSGSSSNERITPGSIAGISVGVAAVVSSMLAVLYLFCRRRRNRIYPAKRKAQENLLIPSNESSEESALHELSSSSCSGKSVSEMPSSTIHELPASL